jgi:hypothetical protein
MDLGHMGEWSLFAMKEKFNCYRQSDDLVQRPFQPNSCPVVTLRNV